MNRRVRWTQNPANMDDYAPESLEAPGNKESPKGLQAAKGKTPSPAHSARTGATSVKVQQESDNEEG